MCNPKVCKVECAAPVRCRLYLCTLQAKNHYDAYACANGQKKKVQTKIDIQNPWSMKTPGKCAFLGHVLNNAILHVFLVGWNIETSDAARSRQRGHILMRVKVIWAFLQQPKGLGTTINRIGITTSTRHNIRFFLQWLNVSFLFVRVRGRHLYALLHPAGFHQEPMKCVTSFWHAFIFGNNIPVGGKSD